VEGALSFLRFCGYVCLELEPDSESDNKGAQDIVDFVGMGFSAKSAPGAARSVEVYSILNPSGIAPHTLMRASTALGLNT
jgi:hypothetical protein